MSIYFSASRERRADLRRRQNVAERLRHHGLDRIAAELAQPADTEPPTYQQTARQAGRSAGGVS
jgi:hypothetical protein